MGAIAAFARLSGHQRIDGQLMRAGGESIAVIDPATEERIGEIAEAAAGDVARAVAAANAAQRAWRKVNHHRRAELLHEVARRVIADRPLVAEMLTREMGKPYKESFDEVGWSASAIDYYAEIARHENGKVLGSAVDGQFHFTTKDPLGVVVIILPFNYPLCLLCWQAAAALASGNAVIIKPSELTTLTTLAVRRSLRCPAGRPRAGDHRRRRRRQAAGRAPRHPHGGLHREASRPGGASRRAAAAPTSAR